MYTHVGVESGLIHVFYVEQSWPDKNNILYTQMYSENSLFCIKLHIKMDIDINLICKISTSEIDVEYIGKKCIADIISKLKEYIN